MYINSKKSVKKTIPGSEEQAERVRVGNDSRTLGLGSCNHCTVWSSPSCWGSPRGRGAASQLEVGVVLRLGYVQEGGLLRTTNVQEGSVLRLSYLQEDGVLRTAHVQEAGLLRTDHVQESGVLMPGYVQEGTM